MIARSFANASASRSFISSSAVRIGDERIAQLVAEHGQELVLGAVAGLGLLARFDLGGDVALCSPRAPQPAVLDHAHEAAAEHPREPG